MKASLKLNILLALFVLFIASLNLSAQIGEINILERMQSHREMMKSLHANISMVNYNSVLKESDRLEGELMYLFPKDKDAMFRVDWMKPAREVLVMVNGKYLTIRPSLASPYTTGKLKDNKPVFLLWLISNSIKSLKDDYYVTYLGTESVGGKIPTWRLEMKPKHSDEIKAINLWVDGNGMIIQAKVEETNSDSTIFSLTSLQKNVTLDAKRFKIPLKRDGIDIVKGF